MSSIGGTCLCVIGTTRVPGHYTVHTGSIDVPFTAVEERVVGHSNLSLTHGTADGVSTSPFKTPYEQSRTVHDRNRNARTGSPCRDQRDKSTQDSDNKKKFKLTRN